MKIHKHSGFPNDCLRPSKSSLGNTDLVHLCSQCSSHWGLQRRRGLCEVPQVELHSSETTFRSDTSLGISLKYHMLFSWMGSLSPPSPPLSPPGPSFPLSSWACTFMDQPLEGSLGPRSRAAEEKVFREILASQGTGVLIPNVLSLTAWQWQRKAETQTSAYWLDPGGNAVHHNHPHHPYWHLLYDRCWASTWHVLSHLILTKNPSCKYCHLCSTDEGTGGIQKLSGL